MDNGQPRNLGRDENLFSALLESARNAVEREFFLDYDGTLAPFRKDPHDAYPSKKLLWILERISTKSMNSVIIVSGRDCATLDRWFAKMPVTLVAEHGAMIKRNSAWESQVNKTTTWQNEINDLMNKFTTRYIGSFIERKDWSLVWHYRNVKATIGAAAINEMVEELNIMAEEGLQVMKGKKIIEVKLKSVNKGNALTLLSSKKEGVFTLTAGDDVTDEDMFKVGGEHTIKVGRGPTVARFRVSTPTEMTHLLDQFTRI